MYCKFFLDCVNLFHAVFYIKEEKYEPSSKDKIFERNSKQRGTK